MSASLIDRFRESMIMNQERWHDGTGYDLELLKDATDSERADIENLLTTKPVTDWRDVEALAFIDTPRARDLLRRTFEHCEPSLRVSIISHAPGLFAEDERSGVLVDLLTGDDEDGLVEAMLLVEEFHPPSVIEALVQGLRTRDPVNADEFAMMLLVIHGKAESLYDLDVRRTLPRFEGDDREAQVRDVCERIGLKS